MNEQKDNSLNNPLRKSVHFDSTVIMPVHSTTSTSLITTSSTVSLSYPLLAEKTGIRFKILILILSLFIALAIGFLLSLIFLTQIIHLPQHTSLSRGYFTTIIEKNFLEKHLLFEQLKSLSIEQFDFQSDICDDFYGFVCRKWLTNHTLNPYEFKRSWLTEKSRDIRENFARILANLTDHYQFENEQNQSHFDDYHELASTSNELEQYYSFHQSYDDESRLIKRDLNSNSIDYSRSISNMFHFYHQCHHTSQVDLVNQLQDLISDHFDFCHGLDSTYFQHSFMHIWNMNTIYLDTQIIVHIQRQIVNQQENFYDFERARLFENYLRQNQIDFCSQSTRINNLTSTIRQYSDLLNSFFFLSSNSSINDDLHELINNKHSLPIFYSSIKQANELKDFLQFLLDREIISSINHSDVYVLIQNFTTDLEFRLLKTPIFRSSILSQCQLFISYYIAFRSIEHLPEYEQWFDYISTSIIQIIIHSWPGDASYVCLHSTIIRQNQFENIFYWKQFIAYTKTQIRGSSSPIINIEIRSIDFFQLDSIFRFLFADYSEHFCNLMIYKYGSKVFSFLSIFQHDLQNQIKQLWKNNFSVQSKSFPLNRFPIDCLTLVETYYPFTLSTFYEKFLTNQISELYSIAYELRDLISQTAKLDYLSSIQFHIKPERLKLYDDLSANIPYEFYSIDKHFLSTSWNLIDRTEEKSIEAVHEFFEINAYYSIEQGIFLQPTIAELYSNESTRQIALLLIAHELGHAHCPCGINLTEREYFADLIGLHLIIDYNEKRLNRTLTSNDLREFFLIYGQSECIHVNRNMIILMNKEENLMELHVNRVVQVNEQFQTIFNCSKDQYQQSQQFNRLLPNLCENCRKKKN